MKAKVVRAGSDLREVHLRICNEGLTPITPSKNVSLNKIKLPYFTPHPWMFPTTRTTLVFQKVGEWSIHNISTSITIQMPLKFIIWLSATNTTSGDFRFTLKYGSAIVAGPREVFVSGINADATRTIVECQANFTTTEAGKNLSLIVESRVNGDGTVMEFGSFEKDSGVSFMCDAIQFSSLEVDKKRISVEFTDAFRSSKRDLYPILIIDGNQIENEENGSLTRNISDSGSYRFTWETPLDPGEYTIQVDIRYTDQKTNSTWSIQESTRIPSEESSGFEIIGVLIIVGIVILLFYLYIRHRKYSAKKKRL